MKPTISSTLLFPLLCSPVITQAHEPARWVWRRASSNRNVPPEGYHDPLQNGGSMLTIIPVTYPMGQGEPINTIISGSSDSHVLVDSEENGGLRNYFLSLGFSGECLGQHDGTHQAANLGDGNGDKNETAVIRWNYGDPSFGTCKETIDGGNHFRYWVQDGPQGNSGAIFMAVSYEMPLAMGHDIVPNGYNLGRDWLIGNITKSEIPSRNLTDSSTFSGTTSSNNWTYHTDIKYVSGLLQNTNFGINHNGSVAVDGFNSSDGLVAVLEVKVTDKPADSGALSVHMAPLTWIPTLLSVSALSFFTLL